MAALEAKEGRTDAEEAELVEYKRQIESLGKKILEAYENQLKLAAWGASVLCASLARGEGMGPRAPTALTRTVPRRV